MMLAACQPAPPASAEGDAAPSKSTPEADARAAVGRYLQSQPNARLYVLDSARVNDNGTSWQVLVPRTDWAGRMPDRARFEVDKITGTVRTGMVK